MAVPVAVAVAVAAVVPAVAVPNKKHRTLSGTLLAKLHDQATAHASSKQQAGRHG